MLAGQSWRDLEGMVLDGRVRLLEMIDADRGAWFLAAWEGAAGSGTADAIAVCAYPWTGEPVLERFLEARFFDHPNLLRCLGAGTAEFGSGKLVYAILERPEKRLRDVVKEHPLPPEEARALGSQLAAGLDYLHQRNLVCCNLDPGTAMFAAGQWKIGDYSELREAGIGYAAETRRLVGSSPATPPEAFEGMVLPAWDVWSLAVLLSASLAEPRSALTVGMSPLSRCNRRKLPEPFQTIVVRCLPANPAGRSTIGHVRELLAAPVEPEEAASETPSAESVDIRLWERTQESKPASRWLAPVAAALISIGIMATVATRLPRQRAESPEAPPLVVLPDPPVAHPRATPRPPPVQPEDDADRGTGAQEVAAIRQLLNRWAAAGRTRDVEAQVACYAPRLDRFYGSRDVPREVVRKDRQHVLKQLGAVRRFDIWNVEITVTHPGNATAVLNKSWEFVGRAIYSGQVREQLSLRKQNGNWKIVSQHDLQVYRSRSS